MAEVEIADELTKVEEEAAVEKELVLVPLATAKIPPAGPPAGKVELLAFLARAMKALSVLPVVWAALIEPTIPDWQWLFVVWEQ